MLGDYTGIGPEQCARVLADRRLADARAAARGRRLARPRAGPARCGRAVRVEDLRDARGRAVGPGRDRHDRPGQPRSFHGFPARRDVPGIGTHRRRDARVHDRARTRRAPRRHHLRAAQQGRAARGRLEVQRRAPDVRQPHEAPGLLRRDERARQQVDVARDLARVAAHRARPDHAAAHRRRADARRRDHARRRHREAAHRGGGPESARRRERPLRPRGDRDHQRRRSRRPRRAASPATAPSPPTRSSSAASAANSTACSPCTTTRARSRPS